MPNKKELQKTPKNELIGLYIDLCNQKDELQRLLRDSRKKSDYLEKKLRAGLEVVTELNGGIQAHQESACKEPYTKEEMESMEKNAIGYNKSYPWLKDKTDQHSLMIGWIASFTNRLRFDYLQYSAGDEETKQQRKPYQLF